MEDSSRGGEDIPKEGGELNRFSNWQFYIATLLFSLLGLGLSYFLITHHMQVKLLGASDSFCNINSFISCDTVARSPYAEFLGLPLGVYGAGFFLGILLMIFVAFKFENYRKDALMTLKLVTIIGALSSVVLGLTSLIAVNALCVNCMGIYITTFILLGINYKYRAVFPEKFQLPALYNGVIYPIVGLSVVILAFQLLKPTTRDVRLELARKMVEDQQKTMMNEGGAEMTIAKDAVEIKVYTSPFSSFGEDYRKGPDTAKVKLVEFSDFQCPACKGGAEIMKQLKLEFGDSLQIVFKNYPLDDSCNPSIKRKFHQFACEAAILARCAGRNGKFWEFHDAVFEGQSGLSSEMLGTTVKSLGLSQGQIDECKKSKDILEKIKDDVAAGSKVGVEGTPSFYLNGRKVLGGGYEAMSTEIKRLLAE